MERYKMDIYNTSFLNLNNLNDFDLLSKKCENASESYVSELIQVTNALRVLLKWYAKHEKLKH